METRQNVFQSQRVKLVAYHFLWTVGEVPVDPSHPTTFVSSKFTDSSNNEWLMRLNIEEKDLDFERLNDSTTRELEIELISIQFSEGAKVLDGFIGGFGFCFCENAECNCLGDDSIDSPSSVFTFRIGEQQCKSTQMIIHKDSIGVGKILQIHLYLCIKNELLHGDCCPRPVDIICNHRISSARPKFWRRLLRIFRTEKVLTATPISPLPLGEQTTSGTEVSPHKGPSRLSLWNTRESNVKLVIPGRIDFVGCNFIWELGKLVKSSSKPVSFVSPPFQDINSNQWLMKVTCSQRKEWSLELMLLEARVGVKAVSVTLGKTSFCSKGTCCQYQDSDFMNGQDHNFELGKETQSFRRILRLPATKLLCTRGSNQVSSIHCQLFMENDAEPGPGPRQQLSLPWKDLHSEAPDVTILTTGKSFPAHKAILSARSTVFAAMFRSELSETKERKVDMTTFPEPVVEGFLVFIYTDQTRIIPEYAEEWLRIADMYGMAGLQNDAERAIGEELSDDNAVDIFCFAHTYNAHLLKTAVTDFIRRNPSVIVSNKTKIQEFANVMPELLAELLMAVAS